MLRIGLAPDAGTAFHYGAPGRCSSRPGWGYQPSTCDYNFRIHCPVDHPFASGGFDNTLENQFWNCEKMIAALVPPKPKELLSTLRSSRVRAVWET